jgi:hypothetical protein
LAADLERDSFDIYGGCDFQKQAYKSRTHAECALIFNNRYLLCHIMDERCTNPFKIFNHTALEGKGLNRCFKI